MERAELVKLCNKLTWGEIRVPEITNPKSQQEKLLYALFNMDMEAVLLSKNTFEYKRATKEDNHPKGILDNNPFYIQKLRIPAVYEVSKGEQCALLPALEDVYGKYRRNIKLKGKVYPVQKCIGYLCDTVLFNAKNSPFEDGMDILGIITRNEEASAVLAYVNARDMKYLRVLASMLKSKVGSVMQNMTVGDLRKGRFISYRKDELPAGQSIMDLMLSIPAALQTPDAFTLWVDNALMSAGVETKDEQIAEAPETKTQVADMAKEAMRVADQLEKDDIDKLVASSMATAIKEESRTDEERALREELQKKADEADERLRAEDEKHVGNQQTIVVDKKKDVEKFFTEQKAGLETKTVSVDVLKDYCSAVGVDYGVVESGLKSLGYDDERLVRALPVYILKVYDKYDKKAMVSYGEKLMEVYGDCVCTMG